MEGNMKKTLWLHDDNQTEMESCDSIEEMEKMIEQHMKNGSSVGDLYVIIGRQVKLINSKVTLQFEEEE